VDPVPDPLLFLLRKSGNSGNRTPEPPDLITRPQRLSKDKSIAVYISEPTFFKGIRMFTLLKNTRTPDLFRSSADERDRG
jgi:hypothetical protein